MPQPGHGPARTKPAPPTTPLTVCAVVYLLMMMVSALLHLAVPRVHSMVHGDLQVLIEVIGGLGLAAFAMAGAAVSVGGLIFGILCIIRLPQGSARIGAIVLTVGFMLGAGGLKAEFEFSGIDLSQPVQLAIAVLPGISALIGVLVMAAGLLQLRLGLSSQQQGAR